MDNNNTIKERKNNRYISTTPTTLATTEGSNTHKSNRIACRNRNRNYTYTTISREPAPLSFQNIPQNKTLDSFHFP